MAYDDTHRADKILMVDKIERETEKAFGVKDANGNMQWLPKSQVVMRHTHLGVELRIPAWLADQKDTFEYEEDDE